MRQFEKLWGDMSALGGVDCGFLAVPRVRGQQLQDPAQLDGWLRDGSAEHVASLCAFPDAPTNSERGTRSERQNDNRGIENEVGEPIPTPWVSCLRSALRVPHSAL